MISTTPQRKPRKKDLYRAANFDELRPRFLHLSGEGLTTNKTYSWIGSKAQFENLVKTKNLKGLIPVSTKDLE